MQKQGFIRIHSPSPYEHLDNETAEWLKILRTMWPLWKKTKVFSDMLYNFFARSECPFTSALKIMVSSGDFLSGKQNSLAFDIMLNFSNWVQLNGMLEIPKPVKVDAVNLVMKQRNGDLLKLVIHTFKVKEDKEVFVDYVKDLAVNNKYKEASQLASLLGLHEHFGIEEFLLPLIFQDKYAAVETFLNDSKRHQLELAVFLDGVIGKSNVMQECISIAENLRISDIRVTFMKYKSLSKLLTKLVRKYNLSPMTCPNMNRKKGKGVLHFLLQKRYVEKNIGGESWSEMVMEAIADDESLHTELVRSLVYYRDFKEARIWAERLNVPKESWPAELLEGESDSGQPSGESWGENWDSNEEAAPALKFHKFPLNESQIKVVDTAQGFNEFLCDMDNGVSVVGIDAEWKPAFGVKQADLALIQVAVSDAVYILDLMALSSAAAQSSWERFASFLFENPNVLKIGFDTRSDLHLIKDFFRKLHCLKTRSDSGFLDLAALWHALVNNHKFVFPFPSTSNNSINLSRLIQICLGETVDKSDQFSNWENRPLRRNQILYAAIDAYCLLEAYDVIVKECARQNIPIAEVIEEISFGSPPRKPKKKGGKHQDESTSEK